MSLAPGYGTPWAGSRTGSDGDSHAPFGGQHHDEESGKLGSGHVGLTHEIESPEIPGRFSDETAGCAGHTVVVRGKHPHHRAVRAWQGLLDVLKSPETYTLRHRHRSSKR
jgi:hypothetical protein